MRTKEHDVIIVGAGPVGSYTAYQLAKRGLDVVVFERNLTIGKDVNCTGIISTECYKRYGLADEMVLRPIQSISAYSPSGNCLRYQSHAPFAYVINRNVFDREMNRIAAGERAATYLNARVKETAIINDAFQVTVRIDEEDVEYRARVGVIATGFELHQIPGMVSLPGEHFYGIQTDVSIKDVNDIEVYFGNQVAPGSFGWVVPVGGNSAKIGLLVKKSPSEYLKSFLQNPLVAQRLGSSAKKIKCSPLPLRRIPKSYGERFLIVGEAAGQVKTTTGGGIYFGLLCAEIAADMIMKAFEKSDFSEKTLSGYEKAWRKRLDPELKAGKILRNIYSRLSDQQIDLLIDLAKRDGVFPVINKTDFDWHKDLISYILRHLFTKKLLRK